MNSNLYEIKDELDFFIKNNMIIDLVSSLSIPVDFNSFEIVERSITSFGKIDGNFSIELDKKVKEAEGGLTIGEYINALYEEKRKEDPKLIGRTIIAGIKKEYKYKLVHNIIHPSKGKLLCLAIAFKLNIEETEKLLRVAGYSLAKENSVFDTILAFFIEKGIYKITEIDEYLDEYNQPVMFSVK